MSKHVLIVGGGVTGLCTAYYAARSGHRVTVLDREGADHPGCSYGNAGLVVPSHFVPLAAPGMVALGLKWMWNPESPFHIKPRLDPALLSWAFKFWRAATPHHVERSAPLLRDLNFASRDCFEELAAVPDSDFGFEQKGLLVLCKTSAALPHEAKVAEHARRLGVPADVLDAKQVASLEPDLQMEIAGAIYFPKDCHLCPERFMALMKRQLKRLGVECRWNLPVTGWRTSSGRVVALQTGAGEMAADEFVICAGSWSPLLSRDLGLTLPMQAGAGYSLTLPNPSIRPRIPAILTEARIAVTPMGTALRFGGTMEIAGLESGLNRRRVKGIIDAVPRYYPGVSRDELTSVEPWRGLRPCSPDGLPYVGRTSRYANVLVGTGHAMMGLSLGPITGKVIAQMISGEKPSLDLTLLDPDRYAT